MPEPIVNRLVVGGVLSIFSLVSAIAMQIGYSTNNEIKRLAEAVTNLSQKVALIDQTVKGLPPVEWQIRITAQEDRLERLEAKLEIALDRLHDRGVK